MRVGFTVVMLLLLSVSLLLYYDSQLSKITDSQLTIKTALTVQYTGISDDNSQLFWVKAPGIEVVEGRVLKTIKTTKSQGLDPEDPELIVKYWVPINEVAITNSWTIDNNADVCFTEVSGGNIELPPCS